MAFCSAPMLIISSSIWCRDFFRRKSGWKKNVQMKILHKNIGRTKNVSKNSHLYSQYSVVWKSSLFSIWISRKRNEKRKHEKKKRKKIKFYFKIFFEQFFVRCRNHGQINNNIARAFIYVLNQCLCTFVVRANCWNERDGERMCVCMCAYILGVHVTHGVGAINWAKHNYENLNYIVRNVSTIYHIKSTVEIIMPSLLTNSSIIYKLKWMGA